MPAHLADIHIHSNKYISRSEQGKIEVPYLNVLMPISVCEKWGSRKLPQPFPGFTCQCTGTNYKLFSGEKIDKCI